LLCRYCATGAYAFERLRSYGEYDGPLGELIRVFKYRGVLALKDFLATCMARTAREEFELGEIQAIVPVPLHRSRERERGFNQSAVLARVLGRQLGLPVREALLLRHRKTRPQTGLTFAQRRQNVRGAFSVRPGVAIDNLRILLVDDVYTTGATAHACAKALRRAGARSVVVLTIARAS
jgi:ComF family protein